MPRLCLALALLFWATPAFADDYSLHILANARLGWTDNIFSASDDPTDQPPEVEQDVYTQLTPGILATWNRPRSIHELSYTLESNLFAEHDEAWTVQHRGGIRGFYLTSPLSELQLQGFASGGTLNTFTTSAKAADGTIGLQPSAASTFYSLDALEVFSLQVSRPLRVTQQALASKFSTKDKETGQRGGGFRVGGGGGLDNSWLYNAVGLNAQVTYDGLVDNTTQMDATAGISWRRDIGEHWTSVVDAGAVALIPLKGGGKNVFQPTVGAQIAYYPDWGQAFLAYRRTVAPNLYIGANTISDSVSLNGRLPLPQLATDANGVPKVAIEGTGGMAFSSIIDTTTGDAIGGFRMALADFAVGYQIREQLNVGLRVQYEKQIADQMLPMSLTVRSFDRSTVLLSFSGRWPERLAGEVPTRATLRVDRSNLDEPSAQPEGQRPR